MGFGIGPPTRGHFEGVQTMQSQPANLGEWITSFGPGERLPLLIVGLILGIFALVFIVTIVSGTIYKMHKNRLETALKRDLLEQGMSAKEIVDVIRAKPGKGVSRGQRIA
jgi:hypothetical protein